MNQSLIKKCIVQVIGRFPIVHGICFLLLLAERASRETYPPFHPNLIYFHMGFLIFCAICMGFDIQRKPAAIIYCLQMLILSISVVSNEELKYRDWVKVRLWHRFIGISGFTLLYGHFTQPRIVSDSLKRFGEVLAGLYLFCVCYIVVESPEDRHSFMQFIPGGSVALYIYVIIVATCAMCYLPGFFVTDASQLLIVLQCGVTILVDSRLEYWTKTRGLDFWLQMWILASNIHIILGIGLYLAFTENPTYDEDEDRLDSLAQGDASIANKKSYEQSSYVKAKKEKVQ